MSRDPQTTAPNQPVVASPERERAGIPVFVDLPAQPNESPVAPAPVGTGRWVAAQVTVSPAAELIAALQSSSADTACAAAAELGRLGDRSAVSALIEAVENISGYFHAMVRAAACVSLGQLGDRSATPTLVRAINDPMAEVSAEAICAVAALGDARAVEPLTAVLDDADGFFHPVVRAAAAEALTQLKSQNSPAVVDDVASEIDPPAIPQAAAEPAANVLEITHKSIAQAAYHLWETNGRPHGTELRDWLQAERELRSMAAHRQSELL